MTALCPTPPASALADNLALAQRPQAPALEGAWERYEQGKRELREAGLGAEQYEAAIRQLANNLGI